MALDDLINSTPELRAFAESANADGLIAALPKYREQVALCFLAQTKFEVGAKLVEKFNATIDKINDGTILTIEDAVAAIAAK